MSNLEIETQWGNNIIVNLKEKGLTPKIETQWGSNVVINVSGLSEKGVEKKLEKVFTKAIKAILKHEKGRDMAGKYGWNFVIIPKNQLEDLLEGHTSQKNSWFSKIFLDSESE